MIRHPTDMLNNYKIVASILYIHIIHILHEQSFSYQFISCKSIINAAEPFKFDSVASLIMYRGGTNRAVSFRLDRN